MMKRLSRVFATLVTLTAISAQAQNGGESDYRYYVRTGHFRKAPPPPPSPTFAQLNAQLAKFEGQPLDVVIDHFGYPDSQREFEGRKLFVWSIATLDAGCSITMEVDAQQTVRRFFVKGNMLGCRAYMAPSAMP